MTDAERIAQERLWRIAFWRHVRQGLSFAESQHLANYLHPLPTRAEVR